ncbi:hypothetical protein ABPG77_008418 [Micractinium sp. CCAP 211/92]
MEELRELRTAVAILYAPSQPRELRHAADAWLRAYVSREGAWRTLADLLATPGASPDERYLAATSLGPLCRRQKGLTDPEAAVALSRLLAAQLAASAAVGCWHTGNQVAAALAAIVARTPGWPPNEAAAQLLALAQGEMAAAHVATAHQQLTLLRLLSALAEVALAKDVGMHPQRREELRAALLVSPLPLLLISQAMTGAGSGPHCEEPAGSFPAAQLAALQLLQAWCSLGTPPAGAESHALLWRQLHLAALHPGELGSAAAEAAAALYACCCASNPDGVASGSSGGSSDPAFSSSGFEQVQHSRQVLGLLLSQLPEYAAGLQQALAQGPGHPQQQQQQVHTLFAALTLLGAAAQAADSCQWAHSAAVSYEAASQAVHLAAEAALAALEHPQFEVVLAGLQHMDEQLERWAQHQAAEQQQHQEQHQQQQRHSQQAWPHRGACTPEQRHALLQRLGSALLQRLVLPADLLAACATADARDLPESVGMVRREVADTFRSAADCLGPQRARQQLLQLARQAQAAWHAVGGAGTGWQQLECCLYALNLVWSRQRDESQAGQAAEQVQQAAEAVAAALQPAVPKLAGTALTLLGGMAEQLLLLLPALGQSESGKQQGDAILSQLLCLLLQLLQQSADKKLSRNAATCCHRLAGCRPLAAALATRHPGWGDELCRCFAAGGGMQQQAQGEDLSTSQFLLVSVCRLAAASATSGEAGGTAEADCSGRSQQAGSSGGSLLRQLLGHVGAAAEAALHAAGQAPPGSAQQQRALGQAVAQVETVAVALEAVAGGMAHQLPDLLAWLEGVLHLAVAAAGGDPRGQQRGQERCGQQPALQEAVCKVAGAMAASPAAGQGLELLLGFTARPQHPAVLHTLRRFVCSSGGSRVGLEPLPAAVSTSLQAAASWLAVDAEPAWQVAALSLGQACLQHLPGVAADAAVLQALLACLEQGMASYHREVCEAVLPCAEALLCIGCRQQRPLPCCSNNGSGGGGGSHVATDASAAVSHLQQQLDTGGLGPGLVLGLLLAAAGGMPPYMMVLVADALYRCWRAAGDARFGGWLRQAALQRAPEGAPWRAWKPEAQAAAVEDLLSPLCSQDARRFKRLLKVFCGGKKKGQLGEPPARGK